MLRGRTVGESGGDSNTQRLLHASSQVCKDAGPSDLTATAPATAAATASARTAAAALITARPRTVSFEEKVAQYLDSARRPRSAEEMEEEEAPTDAEASGQDLNDCRGRPLLTQKEERRDSLPALTARHKFISQYCHLNSVEELRKEREADEHQLVLRAEREREAIATAPPQSLAAAQQPPQQDTLILLHTSSSVPSSTPAMPRMLKRRGVIPSILPPMPCDPFATIPSHVVRVRGLPGTRERARIHTQKLVPPLTLPLRSYALYYAENQ